MAEISLGKVFMTPKGVWDSTKQYQSLDIVMVRGATSSTGYISTDVIPANTPINDKRWKVLFTVNDGEATADFNNKVNKVDENKKAVDTIYTELQKMYGVQISDTEPTEERTGIWVDTSSTETFNVPEIKDNVVNDVDTWSSSKINQMVSVDSYAAKSDACADDDRIAIYDSVSKTQKKALFGGGVWNWIVNKLTNAVINNLQTNNKTVLGAINELNSKTQVTWLLKGGILIPDNSDLNDYKNPGVYYVSYSESVKTILNTPITKEFKLMVEYQFGDNARYIMQTFIDYITLIRYCRRSDNYGTTWLEWKQMDSPSGI